MRKAKVLYDQVQLELFHPRPTLPRWIDLPTEVREEVGELVAQLLSVYVADQVLGTHAKEFDNE